MAMGVRPDVPKQEEMTVESVGQQPVVVLKQGNACGAKGHSQVDTHYNLKFDKEAVVHNWLTPIQKS